MVEVAVLELTLDQLQWVTFTEFGYSFGRFEDVEIELTTGEDLSSAYGYVQRLGLFPTGDQPAALSAVPATGRVFQALAQHELARDFASRHGTSFATPQAMLTELLADPAAFASRHYERPLAAAIHVSLPRFLHHPASSRR